MPDVNNLGKIHVFPSEAVYKQHSSELGDSDLALVRDDVLEKIKGNTAPTMTALCDWEAMKALNGGTDVRNYTDTSTGQKSYGGDASFPDVRGGTKRKGTIILKQPFTNFDKILVVHSHDNALYSSVTIIDSWALYWQMHCGGIVPLIKDVTQYWNIRPMANSTLTPLSTAQRFFSYEQNSAIIEIYGLKY